MEENINISNVFYWLGKEKSNVWLLLLSCNIKNKTKKEKILDTIVIFSTFEDYFNEDDFSRKQ